MEIEIKILDISRPKIEGKLAEMQAKKTFEGELLAIFYDDEKGALVQQKSALRLRKEGEKTMLTFKKAISTEGAKIMDEREVSVSDTETMRSILSALGYLEIKNTRKIRTEYEWKSVKIVLDEYLDELNFIPLFLEVEAPTLAEVYEAVEALGYEKDDCNTFNTYDLEKFYKQNEPSP